MTVIGGTVDGRTVDGRKRPRTRAALAVLVFVVVCLACAPVRASAATPPAFVPFNSVCTGDGDAATSAAVVVDLGDGDVRRTCVRLDAPSITGLEALQRAGASPVVRGFSGQGVAVCALCGTGCGAGNDCLTCQAPKYWGYFRAEPGATSFTYSTVGAGATTVRAGGVEIWRWGTQATTATTKPAPGGAPTTVPTAPAASGSAPGGAPSAAAPGSAPGGSPGSVSGGSSTGTADVAATGTTQGAGAAPGATAVPGDTAAAGAGDPGAPAPGTTDATDTPRAGSATLASGALGAPSTRRSGRAAPDAVPVTVAAVTVSLLLVAAVVAVSFVRRRRRAAAATAAAIAPPERR